MEFDKKYFKKAANEVLNDIEEEKLRSKSWIWIASGALIGFLSSCIKFKIKSGRPILARFSKVKDEKEI